MLVTTFLRKLSIYGENKQRMAEAGLVARLVPLVEAGKAHGSCGGVAPRRQRELCFESVERVLSKGLGGVRGAEQA